MKPVGRLHVLTDTVLQSRFSHAELTRLAVAGGADTVQFRQKCGAVRDMIHTVEAMRALCEAGGAVCIVNDRIDIAMAAGSHGVHLGREDFPVPLARRFLGAECIIGGSASSLEEAEMRVSEGVDYIGFGPVFSTTSKSDAGPAGGVKILEQVVRRVSLPVVAIGGIHRENVGTVLRAGVHGVAVISAVCCQNDPKAAAASLLEAMDAAIGKSDG